MTSLTALIVAPQSTARVPKVMSPGTRDQQHFTFVLVAYGSLLLSQAYILAPGVAYSLVVFPSLRSKFAVPVRGGHSTIHEDVAAGDEPTVRAHEQRGDSSHLVRSASASSRR